jgi:hypothetical protein
LDSQKQINMAELLKEVFVQLSGRQFHPLLFSILLYVSGYIHTSMRTYLSTPLLMSVCTRAHTHTHTHPHTHTHV